MKLPRLSILLLAIVVIGLISMTNNVYATEPVVSSFTLQNLDNSIPAYSDGDTLTITFNIDTDLGGIFVLNVPVGLANVDALFDNDGLGTNYDGQWIDARTFVISVIDSTGHDMVLGQSFLDPSAISIRDVAFPADIWILQSPLFLLERLGGGEGCNTECEHPTLGVDKHGNRLVEDGFSYNGNPVDVEGFFTPYPLIKTTTGILNTAELKIYDNSGPENIRHVELAFGLAKGQTINQRTASIFWDKHFDGTEIIRVDSPTYAIGHVKVESKTESCKFGGIAQCLVLIIDHRFRAPLEFDIVGTNVWDSNRNAWQNYFNHGIHVEGESQNPAPQYLGIHNGHIIEIIEIDTNVGIDSNGNTWIFDKIWKMNTSPKGKIDDGVTSHGFDRNSARFNTYKQGQELQAQSILNDMLGGPINNDLLEPKSYDFEFIKRSDDQELQKRISEEKKRAYDLFFELYDLEYYN